MRIIFTCIYIVVSQFCLYSQTILDWNTFKNDVQNYHPVSIQADLIQGGARAALLRAKGGFDVKTYAENESKFFKGKQYFQYTEAGIKWPTLMGLTAKTAYNQATGNFINNESILPSNGQASIGLEWTVGQGLLIDERRADMQSANIGVLMGATERAIMLNELLYLSAKAYWTWSFADNQLSVISAALIQAIQRHEAIKLSFVQGERSAMDTLETSIQVQNRRLEVNFANIERQNAMLEVSNFWWNENRVNRSLSDMIRSDRLTDSVWVSAIKVDTSTSMVNQLTAIHPIVMYYTQKQQQLSVERRFKQEKKKPVVDLYYYLLGSGWNFTDVPSETGEGTVFANNTKFGIRFSYPLQNRKARGDWQMTDIKMAQNDLQIRQKKIEIAAKIRQYANELNNLRVQTILYRDLTNQYRTLLDFEIDRFAAGESSVFLVNTREQRWLDAQIKYLKLIAETKKAESALVWAMGTW